jgi:ankyrin repeat protein
MIQILLSKGFNINTCSFENQSPLHFAAKFGYCSIVLLLLNNGIDIHFISPENRTAFLEACDHGHLDFVKLLLFNDANIEDRTKKMEKLDFS